MRKRYVSIWFRYLVTDWFSVRMPSLKDSPFVVSKADHGRMVVAAANASAKSHGIETGMTLADARAICPSLKVEDDKAGLTDRLLHAFAGWCIRFTPVVSVDPPDGLILDATGCAHLWNGEEAYISDIINRISLRGYSVKAGMADTIGAAWAIARYQKSSPDIPPAQQSFSLNKKVPSGQQTHSTKTIVPAAQPSQALQTNVPPGKQTQAKQTHSHQTHVQQTHSKQTKSPQTIVPPGKPSQSLQTNVPSGKQTQSQQINVPTTPQTQVQQTHVQQTHSKPTQAQQTQSRQTIVPSGQQTHTQQTHSQQTHSQQTHSHQTHVQQTHSKQTQALQTIIPSGQQSEALKSLPPEALRLDTELSLRFHKLGLHHVGLLLGLQRAALRRRFGDTFLLRLDQALGNQEEWIQPLHPPEPYQERLPCLEPIITRTGIEIALQTLLNTLCTRLKQEQNGLRQASLKCYRTDGKIETTEITTHLPSHHTDHLFKLFDIKLSTIRPESGIDLFILQAGKVEPHHPRQEKLWQGSTDDQDERISELIDRIAGKFGEQSVHRYLPDEHHWPERSFKKATTLLEKATTGWRQDQPRPVQLFFKPVPVHVTAPIPDYPPMLFRHKGKLHKIMKADGPERIEQEWWIQDGEHRDYYRVEDEEGNRFWLFRSGHYTGDKTQQWFIHGLFA